MTTLTDRLTTWIANGTDRLLEETGRMSQVSMPIGPPEERFTKDETE